MLKFLQISKGIPTNIKNGEMNAVRLDVRFSEEQTQC